MARSNVIIRPIVSSLAFIVLVVSGGAMPVSGQGDIQCRTVGPRLPARHDPLREHGFTLVHFAASTAKTASEVVSTFATPTGLPLRS